MLALTCPLLYDLLVLIWNLILAFNIDFGFDLFQYFTCDLFSLTL